MRLLRYLASSNKTLSEVVASLPQYASSPEVKLYCDDDKKVELITKLGPIVRADYPDAEVVDDERAGDGLRLDLPESMFVVRYSQNGPYLGIKFEGKTKEQYEEIRSYLAGLLHKFPEVDWKNRISANVEALEGAER